MTMQSNTLHEIPTASAPLPMHRNDSNLASSRSPPVPRLFDLCKHVLRTNVAHIVDVGDIPYEMISDILYGCRVNQLRDIEDSSPHIAEEDEDIWEHFFKRDFPIVAEARAKAATSKTAASSFPPASATTKTSTVKAKKTTASKTETSYSTESGIQRHESEVEDDIEDLDDDLLFTSYRDLYYDEQVRREERLASAGERLKERLNHLAEVKSGRQTILDPRLSLHLRKRRRGQTLPTGRMLSNVRGQQRQPVFRTKSLAERARAKATMIAANRSQPPQFTRSASMSVGLIPPKPRPLYKESSLDSVDGQSNISLSKGIYGPRRGKVLSATSAVSRTDLMASNGGTKFVERTVTVPAKSSIDKPYKSTRKVVEASPPGKTRVLALPGRELQHKTTSALSSQQAVSPDTTPPVPIRNIPGITRRKQPVKLGMEKDDTISGTRSQSDSTQDTKVVKSVPLPNVSMARPQISPPSTPASSSAGSPPTYSDTNSGPFSPPISESTSTTASDAVSLPMFSQPRRAVPSLFIPRKKSRTTR